MKRTLALLISVLLIVSLFAGCSAKSKLVGTWEGKSEDAKISLTFEKDGNGKMVVSYDGEKETTKFDWEVKDDKIKVTTNEEGEKNTVKWKYEFKGKELKIKYDDQTIRLTKK